MAPAMVWPLLAPHAGSDWAKGLSWRVRPAMEQPPCASQSASLAPEYSGRMERSRRWKRRLRDLVLISQPSVEAQRDMDHVPPESLRCTPVAMASRRRRWRFRLVAL